MNIFSEVKNSVNIISVAEYYGIKVNHNKALCPFHADKGTPSLSFKNGYYHCFGCGAGGDVISLVARLHGTGQKQAAQIINDTFNLGLDINKNITRAEIAKEQRKAAILKKYKAWESYLITRLTERFKLYREYAAHEPPFSDKWTKAMNELPVIEYKLDLLQSDDDKAKLEWFKEELKKAGDKK